MTIKRKYRRFLQNLFLVLITIIILSFKTDETFSLFNTNENVDKETIFKPVIDLLLENNADPDFVQMLINHSSTQFDEKYIRVNVIKSMQKVDYSSHYSDKSARTVSEILRQNIDIFQKCEDIFNIPKEIIASIIWIETKFGSYLGTSHVPSVYLNTALANQIEYINKNVKDNLANHKGPKSGEKSIREKIINRSIKKSNWAIKELLALERIYKENLIDIFSLYGSWAGAFGISQFLPSSYLNWAIDGNADGIIDLFHMGDAVFSVANYLKSNGWGNSDDSKRKALYHYNNSNAYVDAILTLSEKVKNSLLTGQNTEIPTID